MLPVVNGLVVTLFGAQNVRNVLIIVVQISLGKTFCFHIGIPVCRTCLDDNYSLNKQEEFKTGEDVSEKVKSSVISKTCLAHMVGHLKWWMLD